jgi:hypothetical membrane protein
VTRNALDRLAIWAGLLGAVVMGIASIATAVAYIGSSGESYSPLNHYVSELGELGVSRLATVFNLGLEIGGVCFVLFIVGLAAARGGRLRFVYGLTGIVAGVGGALVGVFPMNDLRTHDLVALTFFLLGLVTVLLASIDFVRAPDQRFPRWLAVVGAATVAAFAAFLVVLFGGGSRAVSPLSPPEVRPAVSALTVLEWLLIVGILGWTFLTAWTWRRATR